MLLGELLISQGLASSAQVRAALVRQEQRGGRIGENLVAMGVISRLALEAALRRQYELANAVLSGENLVAQAVRVYGRDHHETDRQRFHLACTLIAAGHFAEALNLARRAHAGHERALGAEHAWTQDSAKAVADAEAAIDGAAGREENVAAE